MADRPGVKRNAKGHYVKGTACPNPKGAARAHTKEYYDALMKTVTIAKWRKIVRMAVLQAQEGDWRARKWIAEYLIGKPPTRMEVVLADPEDAGMSLEDWMTRALERRLDVEG